MSYIGTEPKDIRSFGRTQFDYTATQGQTAFTGADDDGKVLAFTTGQINVYVNGILMDDSDFTTTGTGTVTLASAANLNDVISIVSFESNIPDNDYVPASGGTFTGNVTVNKNSGAILTIETDDTNQATLLFKEGGVSKYNVAHVGSSDTFQVWNYTTNTRALGIDNAGRVTTPSQPAFHVGVSSNQTLAAGDTVVFQQQFENRGSHYNTSNGLFTAPVTGFYSFTYRLLHESVSNGHAVDSYLSKNNSATAGNAFLSQRYKYQADYTGHTGYLSESSSGMIYLAANDTMRVRYSGGQNSTIHNNQNWSYFCGHLVG